MKVLHVIPSLSAAHGGPSNALATIERALLARGLTVETCTTDDDGPGRHNGKPTGLPLAENGVVRRYFRKQSEFYKFSGGFALWMLRHARDYDIVHIHALFSFTSVAAAWAARQAGVPYIVRPLGSLNRYGIERRRPWLKRLSLRLVEGPLLANAAAVHFTSQQEEQEAGELGLQFRSAVIPLGVEQVHPRSPDLIRTRHPELAGTECLLYLSRIDPKKNLEGLLQAIALCRSDLPTLVLLVAGDGDPAYVAQLKVLARDLGVQDRVVWAGRLDGDLKASASAAAKCFVLPSLSENFGIAAAEALAAGLPCILGHGVAIAGEVETANAGVAVDPDAGSIARAIIHVSSSATLRSTMGANATELARSRYSVSAMALALSGLYGRVLDRQKTENRKTT